MAEVIKMPRLSDTMETGKIIKWHKNVGDKILEGEIIAEIETDKAIQEFESDVSGTLIYIGVKEKEITKVDEILAIIGNENEDINQLINNNNISDFNKNSNFYIKKSKRLFISPLAKKLAIENKIPINKITGSGENGRIIKKDIEKYNILNDDNLELKSNITQNIQINHSSMRKIITDRLIKSKFTIPNYYLTIDLIVDPLISLRNKINKNIINSKISFNDLILKIVATALKKNNQINTSWTKEKIIYHSDINIGIVVSVDNGLFIPVIHNADQKSLKQISIETKEKIEKSRSGKIKLKDMEKSTITISNLGMFGINSFTSIINEPNACIISIGAIIEKPIIKNNNICIGNVLNITLSCDHRIIDGAIGSKFLKDIKYILEDPIKILI